MIKYVEKTGIVRKVFCDLCGEEISEAIVPIVLFRKKLLGFMGAKEKNYHNECIIKAIEEKEKVGRITA
jgi:hypothetical protein